MVIANILGMEGSFYVFSYWRAMLCHGREIRGRDKTRLS